MSLRFGIDLGGTKIEIIALDGAREVLRRRVPTPQGDYPATLAAIAALVVQAERTLGRTGSVGVGIPGSRSPLHGRIRNANSVCLIDRDLQGDLERLLERPLRLANDADCFALSEASDGAGAGARSVFGAILGTGVGAGIVVFTLTLTDFAMPAILGGGTNDFIANAIYDAFFRISDAGLGSALSILLVLLGSTIVGVVFAFLGAGTLGFRSRTS